MALAAIDLTVSTSKLMRETLSNISCRAHWGGGGLKCGVVDVGCGACLDVWGVRRRVRMKPRANGCALLRDTSIYSVL